VFWGRAKGRKRPKVVFLFPGELSAGCAVGYTFYKTQSTFRQSFDHCIELLHLSLDGRYADVPPDALLQQIPYSQPVLFAVEYALAELWRSWGITPKAVAGQGVGEYVAACMAGVFSLEDAIKLIVARTQLVQDPFWAERNGEQFADIAQSVCYAPPRIPLISSLTGDAIAEPIATPEYWCQPLQQRDKAGVSPGILAGYDLCLTMGLPMIAASAVLDSNQWAWSQEPTVWSDLLCRVAELYVRGAIIDWVGFDRDYPYRRLQLPTYPFQRQRYWFQSVEIEDVEVSAISSVDQSVKSHAESSHIAPDRSVA
ncbi:MAG: acyltransferase domain-containing protein, partial [Kovacikia sp.]